jgi:hypothetical protein
MIAYKIEKALRTTRVLSMESCDAEEEPFRVSFVLTRKEVPGTQDRDLQILQEMFDEKKLFHLWNHIMAS